MALTKIGNLIEQSTEVNSLGIYKANDVRGVTITKEIIPTKAKVKNTDLSKFLIVKPNEFIYNPRTHGKKIGLGFNQTDKPFIISWNNSAFRVKDESIINPTYLFMYFNRLEWDRQAVFDSWGSSTEVFSWNALCDMEIDLPPLDIQEKYVAVYQAMLDNQKAYENGLEDLKLVCDATIEKLRREIPSEAIGKYIEQIDRRNSDGTVKLAQGVSVDLEFIDAKRVAENFKSGKIVHDGEFAYNKVMKANGTKFPIALRKGETCFISGSYQVFKVSDESKLMSEYLMMWLSRPEIQRYAGYISWGSTRDILQWEILGAIEIPIPDIHIQKSIVDIYNTYITRKEINEKLKQQIKDLCPILIAGAIKEAKANG